MEPLCSSCRWSSPLLICRVFALPSRDVSLTPPSLAQSVAAPFTPRFSGPSLRVPQLLSRESSAFAEFTRLAFFTSCSLFILFACSRGAVGTLHPSSPPLQMTSSRRQGSESGIGGCRDGGNSLPRFLSALRSSFCQLLLAAVFVFSSWFFRAERRGAVFSFAGWCGLDVGRLH